MKRLLLPAVMVLSFGLPGCPFFGGGGGDGDPPPGGGGPGAECASGDDCEDGLACHRGFPGGYCLTQCWDGCGDGTSCTTIAAQDWCLQTCGADSDCREGYTCRAGTCQPPCLTDADCGDGQSCQDGSCVVGGIGGACTGPADCASGLSCAQGLPGGYCTRGCDAEPCPQGTRCVTFSGADYCFDGCLTTADCRSGYVCTGGVCDQACSTDQDCGGGEICLSQACVGAGVGQTCDTGGDCPGGLSCYKGVAEGYCTRDCTSGADCPDGSTCGNMRGARMCLALCRMDIDCGAGQMCLGGTCTLPCSTDADCGADAWCDTVEGVCRGTISGGGNVEVIDFGTINPGSRQSFPVDGQTFAFTIVVDGVSNANYAITSVRTPTGTELVSQDLWTGTLRVAPGEGYAAVTVPNADDSRLYMQSGNWTFEFLSDFGYTGRAMVMLKKSSSGQHVGGLVPMHLYLSPSAIPGVTSSNAASNSHIRSALDRFRNFYRDQAAIDLESVAYFDLPSQYDDITSRSEYGQMFSSYAQDGAMSVFFVRSLSLDGSSDVAGVSGGIPGPPRIGGGISSGVVIEVQDWGRLTGDDMAHELGHYQGLYHITEVDGRTHDRLTDTPQCPDLYSCTTGWYHLMFPSLTDRMDTLTAAGAMVVQGNAVSR